MKSLLRLVGVVLTIAFVLFAFAKVNWQIFVAALAALQYDWIGVVVLGLLASMYFRSVRWFLVTGLSRTYFPKVWKASCAGYLGIIYPARAGEVLRMMRLNELTGMGGGQAIGSAVADRILDGFGLVVLLSALLLNGRDGAIPDAVVAVAWLFVAAGIGMAVFVVSGHGLERFFCRLRFAGKLGERLYSWYQGALKGLQILRSPRRLVQVFACQGLVCLSDILVCYALFCAFGWQLHFMASVTMLIYLTAALSLPSTPGYVGIYQTAAIFALKPYGIEHSEGAAYGSLLQVITLILFIGCGLWAMRGAKTKKSGAMT